MRTEPHRPRGAPFPVLASGVGLGAGVGVLPCSVSFIQGSDRCLSFEGLPEEAFEHLTDLSYLYLANNKVRGPSGEEVCCPRPLGSEAEFRELSPGLLQVPVAAETWPIPHTLTGGVRVVS